MKSLKELSHNINCRIFGNPLTKIKGISYHSQKTKPGYLFVAINGYRTSGKAYIEEAIRKGATAIALDDESFAKKIMNKFSSKITVIYTKTPRQFLALTANRFFNYPSRKLNLIGITGTDGKTTTSYMIKSIISASGKKTALLGTIKYFNGKTWSAAPNTTPESVDFIAFLKGLVDNNIRYCISEVSSHALALDRVLGLDFKVGVFTNLAQDHLDFHKTKKAYGSAKLKLFQSLSARAYAVINDDDRFSKKITTSTKANIIKYSIKKSSDISAEIKNTKLNGFVVQIKINRNSKPIPIKIPLFGEHNVYNMLAAIGVAKALRIPNRFIKNGLKQLKPIPGRLERIKSNKGFDVFIDYAHTASALRQVTQTLKENTLGEVIVVFGCGGNRDSIKRPLMGKIATEIGDYAIITSDNPRHENPKAITEDIVKGIEKRNFEVILKRENAIKRALSLAKPHDAVLVAGKGHEDYQIIGDRLYPFSDKEIVEKVLANKNV